MDRATQVGSAGLTWAVSVGLLAFLGHLLDESLGCTPLFLVLGALAGMAGGFIHFLSRVAPDMLPFGRDQAGGEPSEGPTAHPPKAASTSSPPSPSAAPSGDAAQSPDESRDQP